MAFDTIIRRATLLDGTGSPPVTADLAIQNDRIAAIGDLPPAEATRVIDAAGLTLTPGFIDAHTHSDAFILLEPFSPSKLTQGVTTEIGGQCGGSAAPRHNRAPLPSDWEAQTYPGQTAPGPYWTTFADYRTAFQAARPATNLILFAGHNTLRKGVIGNTPRPATPEEIRAMCRNLQAALEEGAWGLSTGLAYHPGTHAHPEEILALAHTAARHGGHYATHMRSESDTLLEALQEVLTLTRATGIPTQISHLKTAGPPNWHKIDTLLHTLATARQDLPLHADRYPYTAAGTDLDIILPAWATAGGPPAILTRLADPADRARIIAQLNDSGHDPAAIMIGGAWTPQTRRHSGQTLARIIAQTGETLGHAVTRILQADQTRTGAFFFGMSDANLRRILRQPWVMPGSDASLRAPWGPLSLDHPHPRAYGTHPAYYRLLTHELGIPPAETIRRMTSLPAQAFGIPRRGLLKEGWFADLALIDLPAYATAATYEKPHTFATGVRHVFINGAHVLKDGTLNLASPRRGRLLTKTV